MNLKSIFTTAALAISLAVPAYATTVEGTLTSTDSFLAYMGVMTDIQTVSGTDPVPSSGFVFCVEGSNHWAGTGARHEYTLTDSFAAFLETPAAVDKATAMLNYVIDTYYAPLMQGQFGPESGYGFNQAIWQLTDFDGTRNSMRVVPNTDGSDERGDYALYETIMDDLYDHFDTIAPGYRSGRYNIAFLQESDASYQSLGLVTAAEPNQVPEPSTLALMLAGCLGIVLSVRRRQPAV